MKKNTWFLVLLNFVLFVLFMVFVLPGESGRSAALGLEHSPDTSFFYTANQLYDIARQYGEAGRAFYIEQRFTFDLVWPLVYGSFLTTSLAFFGRDLSAKRLKRLYLLPIVVVVFDYFENIMTATVMHRYPLETIILADLAGIFTSLKWMTLSFSFMILLALLGRFIILRFKRRKPV